MKQDTWKIFERYVKDEQDTTSLIKFMYKLSK